jgi:antitoxin HicB
MTDAILATYMERARRYTVVVLPEQEDGLHVAQAADFPGAVGAGTTRDEAAEDLVRGIASMLEQAARRDLPVPAPMRDYTGAVSVRLPKSLHVALAQRANAEGLSVNATVTYLLTQALDLQGEVPPPRRRARAHQAA